MRIPIGYKFIIGFVIVVAAVAFSPQLVGQLGYSAEISSILGYADAEQRQPDQQEGDREQREQPAFFGADDQAPRHQQHHQRGGTQRHRHAEHREPLQRHHRKAGDEVEAASSCSGLCD